MPGYFNLKGKGYSYRMHPVVTSTGAIRLEDQHDGGAVWLQLANKSMLMDQKAGKRLADECIEPGPGGGGRSPQDESGTKLA